MTSLQSLPIWCALQTWALLLVGLAQDIAEVPEESPKEPHLCRLACQVDCGLARIFLSDGPGESEPNRSILRLSPSFSTRDGGRSYRVSLQARGEIDLPLLSDWVDIRFGNAEDEEDLEELDDFRTSDEPQIDRWKDLSLDLRWSNGPEARLRGRAGVTRDTEKTWISADQGLEYRTDRGFGTEFRLRGLYRLNDLDRLHVETSTEWNEFGRGPTREPRGLELRQIAGCYRDLPGYRRVGVRAFAEEFTHPRGTLELIELRPFIRLPLSERAFLRVEPGLAWPRNQDYETTPTFWVRLETFWGLIDDENLGKFYRRP